MTIKRYLIGPDLWVQVGPTDDFFPATQRLFPRTELPDDSSEESLKADIQKLKEKQDMLDKEISQLVKE